MFDDSRTICRHHLLTAYVITFIGIFLIFTINIEVLISQESTASEATDEESDEDDQDTTTINTTGSPNLDVPKEDLIEEYDTAEAQQDVEESTQAGAFNNADRTEPPSQPPPEVEEPEVEESTQAGAFNNADRTEPPSQPPPPEDDLEGGQDTDQMTDGDEGTLTQSTQSSPQNGGGGGGGIHRSTTDGFQIQVPAGRVIEDIENTNSNNQTSEQQTGYTYLARICPLDSALIDNGSRYQCEEASTANVNVMRFDDLHQRPEFASLGNRDGIITTSDFLSYYIQFWQRTAGISDVQILNNIDTAINVIDAQTNQIVATMPAKLVEYTYLYSPQDDSSGTTMTQGREFTLLVVNGGTGYSLYHEGLASSLPSGAPPVQIDQMFDSFTLVTASSAE
jgi:hypothetical protein